MTTYFPTNTNSMCFETDLSPQLQIAVKDATLGLLGYLVIDSFAENRCSGGIRMAHDISLSEVAHLARAMTLKFAFMNSYVGGAKAGIICPLNADEKEKEEILKAFGRNLGPILRTLYAPGGDLGIGPKQVDIIKRAARMNTEIRPATYKAGFFTAYGVFLSAKTVVRELGLTFNDCTFAIEGYGNVGRPLAKFISQAGGKVVAISTIHGAIFSENGLDIDCLAALAMRHGDKVVEVYKDADEIEKSDLFTSDVNIVIPGARAWSINTNNVHEVKAHAVVPAANIPITKEASEVLHRRGITYIPDFVTTSGGIMGCSLLNTGYDEKSVLDIMDKTFETKISKLMEVSNRNNICIEELAVKIAYTNLMRQTHNATLKKNKIKWFITKIKEEKGMVPMLERVASRLYRKLPRRNVSLRNIFKLLAIANAYRNNIDDVRYYPTLTVSD